MGERHRFDPTILREYDIRGIVGETLTDADARAVGRAFGTVVRRKGGSKVCVGMDGRLTSPALAGALAEGLAACGLTVWRIERGPSPMLYYSVFALEADAGVMVTGSHNPPAHNGFKMMLAPGLDPAGAFYGAAIAGLGELAAKGDLETGTGRVETRQVFDAYVERLARDYRPGRALKVAWDAGNGAAGEAMAALAEALPGEHTLLFEEIDGSFPNHHPDPTVPANLADLQGAVRAGGCDLGVAFDGDGDRIGVVDGEGEILWADQLLVFLARDVLRDNPGAPIIADVKASQTLFDAIAAAGGQPVMYKTGHSLIKAKMKALGAPLAGEMSGHIFFADRFYGFDDGLYAAVRLLSILASSEQSLADMRKALPPVVNTPELRFACPHERKAPVLASVREALSRSGAEVDETDGVRVMDDDGWWLLRASNTQDVLVARCEGRDPAALDRLKDALSGALRQAGIDPPAFD